MRAIHPFVIAAALTFVACDGDTDKNTGDSGTTTDETDADTDADSDSDTDADTDSDTDTDTPPLTYYQELGEEPGVRAVLQAFITRVGDDPEINWMFADTDLTALEDALHEQICAATGGPCTYTGDMALIHADMAITDVQWLALITDFVGGLDDNSVPYTADPLGGGTELADPLITVLAGMHDDIVTDPDGTLVYFNQLGGYAAVDAVINGLIDESTSSPYIGFFFTRTDAAVLHDRLVEQVCEATDGYCTYHGAPMDVAHQYMAITNDQFDYLVLDLLETFDDLGVPYTASPLGGGTELADPLITVLAGMRADIVTDDGDPPLVPYTVYFNQLGGYSGIETLMRDFVENQVANDVRINGRFAATDLDDLQLKLTTQICEATGGFCVYQGADMLTAHTGLNITDDEFNYLVEDLLVTFDLYDVGYTPGTFDGGELADPLMQVLAGMHDDIVGH